MCVWRWVRLDLFLVVTKHRGGQPAWSSVDSASLFGGVRAQTLLNKSREKWEGSKLEGKTEESIELWLHTPSLSQTLSNGIFRSRLLPSLRLCCYGDVCTRASRHAASDCFKVAEGKRESESEWYATRQEDMEKMWRLEEKCEQRRYINGVSGCLF